MKRISTWLDRFRSGRPRPSARRRAPRFEPRRLLGLEVLEGRLVPAGVQAIYSVVNNWGAGLQAQIQVLNGQQQSVSNWQLGFDYTANLSSIWDAKIVSHTGNHYVIAGLSYDNNVSAGGSVTFGFVASPGGAVAAPSNYTINGAALGQTATPLPSLSIADISVAEPTSGTKTSNFSVVLSAASATPVTVKYATADGTGRAGVDYQATSGTLTFAPGQTQQTIAVGILNNPQAGNQSFLLNLSSPAGATLARAQATATIQDSAPATGSFQFQVMSDWGSGYTGQITIKNPGSTDVTNWSLEFDYAGQISSIWNAKITSHAGNHYAVAAESWNTTIPKGGAVSFGFNASPGNVTAGPTNYKLVGSGSSSGSGGTGGTGGTGSTNHPPVAGSASAVTTVGQPVLVNVLAGASDPDGDSLTVGAATQGQNGSVVVNTAGSVTYTPKAGFTGTDSFTYTVSDGRGGTANGTASVTVTAAVTASAWPAHYFAPYVDTTLYPMYDMAAAAKNQGIKYFTLAFITADPSSGPAWGGYAAYDVNNGGTFETQIKGQIASVRSLGGDVMVSFGGAAGQELAQVISNLTTLQNAYRAVITDYSLTHIDFDIEGAAVADRASIDRRSQAIAALQKEAQAAGRQLYVNFTLPVLPTGLTSDGLYVLQSALKYGVQIGGVNVMAMDYGDGAAPNPAGQMGTYAIQAAQSTFNQLKSLYGTTRTDAQLWPMVGVTPMIGVNDATTEIFDQAAARQLLAFAQQKGMGELSFWSLNRDQQDPSGKLGYPTNTSSSVLQNPYEFSTILKAFTSN